MLVTQPSCVGKIFISKLNTNIALQDPLGLSHWSLKRNLRKRADADEHSFMMLT